GYTRVLPELAESPSKQRLQQNLVRWLTDEDRRPSDQLVFYYTGHGETLDRHYLIPADGRYQRDTQRLITSSAVAVETLLHPLFVDSPVQHALVILDTCYSGRGIGDLSRL